MVAHRADNIEDNTLQLSESSGRHFLFKRTARLLTPKDYKHTFDTVHIKLHQPNLMCLISVHSKNNLIDDQKLKSSRLGLAISKAKNKAAPERNRIKRLIREYFRLHQHELPETVDMVFLTKTRTDNISNDTLYRQLEIIWRKLIKRLS